MINLNSFRKTILIGLYPMYSFLSILLTWTTIQKIDPNFINVYKTFEYIIIVLLILLDLTTINSINCFVKYTFCLLLGVYSLVILHDYRFLMFILFIFVEQNTTPIFAIKVDLFFKIIAFIITIFLYVSQIIPNQIYYRVGENVVRQTLGFAHPNFLSALVLLIILEYAYIRKRKINTFEIIGLGIFALIFNNYSDSRISMCLSCLFLLGIFFIRNYDEEEKEKILKSEFIKKFVETVPWIFALISIFATIFLSQSSQIYKLINSISSSRMDIFQFYYSANGGVHLFPVQSGVLFQNSTFVGMDNIYIYLLVSFGLICLLIYLYYLTKKIRMLINVNDILSLWIIIIFCIWGMVESTIIYPFVGFFFLFNDSKMEGKK